MVLTLQLQFSEACTHGQADLGGRVAEMHILRPLCICAEGLEGLWLVQRDKAELPIAVRHLSITLSLCARLAAGVPAHREHMMQLDTEQ